MRRLPQISIVAAELAVIIQSLRPWMAWITRRLYCVGPWVGSYNQSFFQLLVSCHLLLSCIITSPSLVGEVLHVWLFVCLSVRSHISETACPNFTNLLYLLPVVAARSSSYGNLLCYVLPVL